MYKVDLTIQRIVKLTQRGIRNYDVVLTYSAVKRAGGGVAYHQKLEIQAPLARSMAANELYVRRKLFPV